MNIIKKDIIFDVAAVKIKEEVYGYYASLRSEKLDLYLWKDGTIMSLATFTVCKEYKNDAYFDNLEECLGNVRKWYREAIIVVKT